MISTPPTDETRENDPDSRKPISLILLEIAHDASRARVSIQDLFDALGDRALAALMILLAAPNMLPVPPGVSGVLGVPLIFLATQLIFGQAPWLPRFIARRSLARSDFTILVRRLVPWLAKAERLLRPRLLQASSKWMEHFLGCICLLMAVVLALPIPLGNPPPALAISVLALGILERDGYWIIAGVLIAVGATLFVSGVVFAMIEMGIYLIAELFR